MIETPARGEDWIAVDEAVLPVGEASSWAVRPGCGAVVTFCGTVRDHSEGRPGVEYLEYEAFPEQVAPRLARVADEARRRWPEIGRLVLLHRVGRLSVTEVSVVVVASTPNRPAAFEAARFMIDTLKATVPIWKFEKWAGGSEWSDGTCLIDGEAGGHGEHHGDDHTRVPEESREVLEQGSGR